MEKRMRKLEKLVVFLVAVIIALFVALCSFATNMEHRTQEILNTVVAVTQER